jgi:hypothetical protein
VATVINYNDKNGLLENIPFLSCILEIVPLSHLKVKKSFLHTLIVLYDYTSETVIQKGHVRSESEAKEYPD